MSKLRKSLLLALMTVLLFVTAVFAFFTFGSDKTTLEAEAATTITPTQAHTTAFGSATGHSGTDVVAVNSSNIASIVWTPGKKYYLTGDVTLPSSNDNIIINSGTIDLCLCGHTLSDSIGGSFINITFGAFNLHNCTGNGVITGGDQPTGGAVNILGPSADFNMYGGALTGNKSAYGGAVYIERGGTFNMYGGTITGNKTSYGGGVHVGGIDGQTGGSFYMYGGTIGNNEPQSGANATLDGGGVYVDSPVSTFIMFGGNISDNKNAKNGGGVYVNTGFFRMEGGMISNNTAQSGGGVYLAGGTFTMESGYIGMEGVHNAASTAGGGVYVNTGATFNMEGGTLECNQATTYGGGVSNDGTFNLKKGNICSNSASNGAGVSNSNIFNMLGGKIYNNSASAGSGGGVETTYQFTMTGGEIYSNSAKNGGGVYINDGTFTMKGGTIGGSKAHKNTATYNGGGVYVADCYDFYMEAGENGASGTISYNEAMKGGGVYVDCGTFEMSAGKISNNTAGADGGGVYATYANSLSMSNGEISNNAASINGGGVYADYTDFSMSGTSKINYNHALNGNGGGVYVSGNYQLTMTSGEMIGNEAKGTNGRNGSGGAVYIYGTFAMADGMISMNTASIGAVAVYGDYYFRLSGGKVIDNYDVDGNNSNVYISRSATFETADASGKLCKLKDGTRVGVTIRDEDGSDNPTFAYEYTKNNTVKPSVYFFDDGGRCIALSNTSAIVCDHDPDGDWVAGTGDDEGYHYQTCNECGEKLYLEEHEYGSWSAGTGANAGYHVRTCTVCGATDRAAHTYGSWFAGTGANAGYHVRTCTVCSGLDKAAHNYNDGTNPEGTCGTCGDYMPCKVTVGTTDKYLASVSDAINWTSGSGSLTAKITLLDNVGVQNGTLFIASNKNITLDLNGYILKGTGSGSVLTVNTTGTLTVVDGRPTATHRYNYVNNLYEFTDNGSKTLQGGVIAGGNKTGDGGGIYVNGGTLNLTAGNISGNRTTGKGGGVSVNGGTLTVSGTAKIAGNLSSDHGGGIYVGGSGTFNLTGGTITENNTTGQGGGFYNNGTLNVSGTPVVTGNTKGANANNGYVQKGSSATIHIANALSDPAQIGLNSPDNRIEFSGTDKLGDKKISDFFVYDNGGCVVNSGGAHKLGDYILSATKHWHECADCGAIVDEENHNSLGDDGTCTVCTVATVTHDSAVTNYSTFKAAWDYADGLSSAGTKQATVKMYADAEVANGTLTISLGKYTTLDLNGYILKGTGSGSVITANGLFTLDDSRPTATHKYNVVDGLYVFVANGTKELQGGVITGGNKTGDGGGVYSYGTFTMKGGNISGNKASSEGGGVSVSVGVFKMSGEAAISGNTAGGDGGGLTFYGSVLEMSGNATISANTSGQTGGGVYFGGDTFSTFTMSGNATISGNIADRDSGGVYVDEGTFKMSDNATISSNIAQDGNGGGVTFYGSTLEMSGDAVISGNKATGYGGGVYFLGTEPGVEFTMSGNSTISDNEAESGGGVHLNFSTFKMSGNSTISGNEATSDGAGGVYFSGTEFTMSGDSTISDNTATDNNGGGVYIYSGTFTMEGGTISGNTADNGGGVYVYGGTFTMEGGTIGGATADDGNQATTYGDGNGGGVYVNKGASFTMRDGLISNNKALTGGGVYIAGTATIYDGTISYNSAYRDRDSECGNGGGLYVFGSYSEEYKAKLDMYGGTITRNTARSEGAGVSINYAEFTMHEKTNGKVAMITSNTLEGSDASGGGVYVYSHSLFIMKDGEISGNIATDSGNGVVVGFSSEFQMLGGEIKDNISSSEGSDGGGVSIFNKSTFTMENGTISGNAVTDYGGGIYLRDSEFTMKGGTISGNEATYGGGGVCVDCGTFKMSDNATISGNTASEGNGGGVYVWEGYVIMEGGVINGNKASDGRGGGVYLRDGTLRISAGRITGNKVDSEKTTENVYLTANKQITIDATLSGTNQVGITLADDYTGAFTSGYGTSGNDNDQKGYFFADNGECIWRTANGELSLGHVWLPPTITAQPTCTQEGTKTSYCEKCKIDKSEPVDALGHLVDMDGVSRQEPDCVHEGHIAYYTCDREGCDDGCYGKHYESYDEETGLFGNEITDADYVLPALGHVYGEPDWNWDEVSTDPDTAKVTVTFTCTVDGCDADCEGHTLTVEVEHNNNPAEGALNTLTSVTSPASCNAEGKITYTAEVSISDRNGNHHYDNKSNPHEETLAATGEHNWTATFDWSNFKVDGTVTVTFTCDATEGVSHSDTDTDLEKDTVTVSAPTKVKDPDCIHKGTNRYTASITFDGEEFTEDKDYDDIDATGVHVYESDFTIDTDPTCTTEGSKSKHCVVEGCTAKDEITSIAALGHDWGEDGLTVTAPNLAYQAFDTIDLNGLVISGSCKREGCTHSVTYTYDKDSAAANSVKYEDGTSVGILHYSEDPYKITVNVPFAQYDFLEGINTYDHEFEITVAKREVSENVTWEYLQGSSWIAFADGADPKYDGSAHTVRVRFPKHTNDGDGEMVKVFTATFKDVQAGGYTYELTDDDFAEYVVDSDNNSHTIIVTRIQVFEGGKNWLDGDDAELMSGSYKIEDGAYRYYPAGTAGATDVTNAVVRFEDGDTVRVAYPDGTLYTIAYTGDYTATASGEYTVTATLTLKDTVNYEFIAADGTSLGDSIEVVKTWYAAFCDNGFTTAVTGWTWKFGTTANTLPALKHDDDADESVTLVLTLNGKQIGEFNRGEASYSQYINSTMPAGTYSLAITVHEVTVDGVTYTGFGRTISFTVAKATFTVSNFGELTAIETTYDGKAHVHQDFEPTATLMTSREGVWADEEYDGYYGGAKVVYSHASWNGEYLTAEDIENATKNPDKLFINANADSYVALYKVIAPNYEDLTDSTCSFTVKVAKASYDMTGVVFDDVTIAAYDGKAHSVEVDADTLPAGVRVQFYDNNAQTKANETGYLVTAFFTGDLVNYEPIDPLTAKLTIMKANYVLGDDVVFDDGEFEYNGKPHTLEVTGTLPKGVYVTYKNNGQTNADSYEVTAEFHGDYDNYNEIPDKKATLLINKKVISLALSFADERIEVGYDGKPHSVELVGDVPEEVEVAYTNNSNKVNVGDYPATATVTLKDSRNYKFAEGTQTYYETMLVITLGKLDMSKVSFNDRLDAVYTGKSYSLSITGTLPAGVTYSYDNNGHVDAGEYEVKVYFYHNHSNYDAIEPMTATLKIKQAEYNMSGVTFPSATVAYTGKPHSLAIKGTLPAGVTYTYDEHNSLTNVGSQVVTVSFTGDSKNYLPIPDMKATLTVTPASLGLKNVSLEGSTVNYDGKTHTLAVKGTLPEGVTVKYYITVDGKEVEFTGATSAGTYDVTAKFTVPENYKAIRPLTARLTINAPAQSGGQQPEIIEPPVSTIETPIDGGQGSNQTANAVMSEPVQEEEGIEGWIIAVCIIAVEVVAVAAIGGYIAFGSFKRKKR